MTKTLNKMVGFKSLFNRRISEELVLAKTINNAKHEIEAYLKFSFKDHYERMVASDSLESFVYEYELLYELIFENLQRKKDNFDDYPYEDDENALDRSLALSETITQINEKMKRHSY